MSEKEKTIDMLKELLEAVEKSEAAESEIRMQATLKDKDDSDLKMTVTGAVFHITVKTHWKQDDEVTF